MFFKQIACCGPQHCTLHKLPGQQQLTEAALLFM
jgi:hypothetical protein